MILPISFYTRSTLQVAKSLLGMHLYHRDLQGRVHSGKIVETEAYLGPDDLASHARFGKQVRGAWQPSVRASLMYGAPGVAYVYTIYGLHHCFNVVAHEVGGVGAVLIRALQPTNLDQNTKGPARLCKTLGIDKHANGLPVTSVEISCVWLADLGTTVAQAEVGTSARIGVHYAGLHAENPYRFFVQNNPYVSR